jgi:hypothetical protein
VLLWTGLLLGGILLLDWFTPLGYAVWLLYAVALLLGYWVTRRGFLYGLAALCSLLMATGFFLSPPGINASVAMGASQFLNTH